MRLWKRGEVVPLLPAAATGFLTRLRMVRCSGVERWPVQPTSTPNVQLREAAKAAVLLARAAVYVVHMYSIV